MNAYQMFQARLKHEEQVLLGRAQHKAMVYSGKPWKKPRNGRVVLVKSGVRRHRVGLQFGIRV